VNVVADGVHSRLRNVVVGSDNYVAKKVGLTCYRVAVSVDDAKSALGNLSFPHWWEPSTCQNRSSIIYSGDGSGRVVTVYPICGQTSFNISCIMKSEDLTEASEGSWHAEADRNKMMDAFGDFNEQLRIILRSDSYYSLAKNPQKLTFKSAAKEVKVWELQDLEALPTWTRGRVILIGDAAHAMTPMQGQGANMSIEDAESLRLLVPGTLRGDVLDILRLVDSVRRPRTAQVLAETRKSHSGMGVAERAIKNIEFNCGYNGIEEALKIQRRETGS
jgi:salicylate hydroxylase